MSDPEPLDRAEGGHFAKGNKGGPGNPQMKNMSAWRSRFFKLITEADFDGAYLALMNEAKAGDTKAIALFLSYAIGRPVEFEDDDGQDRRPIVFRISGLPAAKAE